MAVGVQLDEATLVGALQEARDRTHRLVAGVTDADLERVHSTLMSPLVWDLGHIAAFEDLWICHRHGALPLLREGLAEIYDAFESPRAGRGDLDFLRPEAARAYLAEVRERALHVLGERGVGDGVVCELIIRHEHQHNETMLQTMALAHLDGFAEPPAVSPASGAPDAPGAPGAPGAPEASTLTGLETIAVPGGPCTVGAAADGFAYDNERPRHTVDVAAFEIGRVPVTNGAWAQFTAAGGYARREWWSPDGWAWRASVDARRPLHWAHDDEREWRLGELVALHPARPVAHISWFEADAFARAHGARLPTEAEWEKAATWDAGADRARAHPWGDERAIPGRHATLDQLSRGPSPVGSLPAGASPVGAEQMIGDVWEWTASPFRGYPGFAAFPYREYSEAFFGDRYRTLRGGSWATRPRVATAAFRNWDLPERRQIFSGVRIARSP